MALSLIPMGVLTRLVRASVLEIFRPGLRANLAGEGFMGADGDVARHEECRPASVDF